jgi:hypothetical protein
MNSLCNSIGKHYNKNYFVRSKVGNDKWQHLNIYHEMINRPLVYFIPTAKNYKIEYFLWTMFRNTL